MRLRQSAVTSLTVNVTDTFVSESATEDPTISFVNSVFRISNGANAAQSIGTQISGKPSNTGFGTQSLFLQAIRTDTVTGACTSIFPSGSEVDIAGGRAVVVMPMMVGDPEPQSESQGDEQA